MHLSASLKFERDAAPAPTTLLRCRGSSYSHFYNVLFSMNELQEALRAIQTPQQEKLKYSMRCS